MKTTTLKLEHTLDKFGITDNRDIMKLSLLKLRRIFNQNDIINFIPEDHKLKTLFKIYNYFDSLN